MRLPREVGWSFQHRGQGFLPSRDPRGQLGDPFLRKEERARVHEFTIQMTRCSVQGPRIARSHCWL